MASASPPSADVAATPRPWFAALTGVTSLLIFLQAVTAGQFVSQDHRDGWIAAHSVVGALAVLAALVTAIAALITMRRSAPSLTWGSVALFVLLVVQYVIGNFITEGHLDGWIGVHVPLAFVIFGLTIWLSIRASAARRASAVRS